MSDNIQCVVEGCEVLAEIEVERGDDTLWFCGKHYGTFIAEQTGTWRRKDTLFLNERYHFYDDNDVFPICRTFISRLVTEPASDDNIVKCRKCKERSKP